MPLPHLAPQASASSSAALNSPPGSMPSIFIILHKDNNSLLNVRMAVQHWPVVSDSAHTLLAA